MHRVANCGAARPWIRPDRALLEGCLRSCGPPEPILGNSTSERTQRDGHARLRPYRSPRSDHEADIRAAFVRMVIHGSTAATTPRRALRVQLREAGRVTSFSVKYVGPAAQALHVATAL